MMWAQEPCALVASARSCLLVSHHLRDFVRGVGDSMCHVPVNGQGDAKEPRALDARRVDEW
jgi:hypothetical protein